MGEPRRRRRRLLVTEAALLRLELLLLLDFLQLLVLAATAPQPLPGGGYCFCDDHCRLWFTDNNSGGSCCPDWRQVCEGVKEGTTCLDARAQGSALGLFVAAAVVT